MYLFVCLFVVVVVVVFFLFCFLFCFLFVCLLVCFLITLVEVTYGVTLTFNDIKHSFMKLLLYWYKSWFDLYNFWSKHKIYSYLGIFRCYSIFHQRVSDVTGCIDLFDLWPDNCFVDSREFVTALLRLLLVQITCFFLVLIICVVIKQDESAVGNDMLLVSYVLLHLSIMQCQC